MKCLGSLRPIRLQTYLPTEQFTCKLLTAPIRARPEPMAIIVGTMLNFPACKAEPGHWSKSKASLLRKRTAFVPAVPAR